MRLWRYGLAAFFFDWVLYILWTVIPIHAVKLGASASRLACLQTAASVVYVAMCIVVGRLADRIAKPWIVRAGCAGMAVSCWLIGRTHEYGALLLLVPLAGLSSSLFWPPVQASIGAEAKPEELERAIGLFNVLWSLGKGLGFVSAGAIHAWLGTPKTLLVAAAGALGIALLYPWRDVKGSAHAPEIDVDPATRMTFLRIAWVANFALFGVGAIVANQYFKLVEMHRIGSGLFASFRSPTEVFFGTFLGLVYLAQSAVFVLLGRSSRWTYRRGPLYLTHLLLGGAAAGLAFVRSEPALLALAPLIGIGLGYGYASSIYYSLHTPQGHGKFSGLHEAVLGSGNFVLPLAAGILADRLFDLRLPYWLAAAGALAAVAVEEAIYRRRT